MTETTGSPERRAPGIEPIAEETDQLDEQVAGEAAASVPAFNNLRGVERFRPIKVIDVDVGSPLPTLEGLHRYGGVRALVRLHGAPIGAVFVPVVNGRCDGASLHRAIARSPCASRAGVHLLSDLLFHGLSSEPEISDVLAVKHPPTGEDLPSMTVAICTHNRAEMLRDCLNAVAELVYPNLEVLVVDNAPGDDTTRRLVEENFPSFRYIQEPRLGLDWARNRAIAEAGGEILAFTDDDTVVDLGWAAAVGRVFAEERSVDGVTGLVIPFELETRAQALFEQYGGFGRGYVRRWHRKTSQRAYVGIGMLGTGANMAFRCALFNEIGAFDPALDVGTVTNGGGDLEIFYRLLKEGFTLIYEPAAVVRHRHRRDYASLRRQITDNGIGFYSYLTRSALAYPAERRRIVRFGVRWLWRWSGRRLLKSLIRPSSFPRDLILTELYGSLVGLTRYHLARAHVRRLVGAHGGQVPSLRSTGAQARVPTGAVGIRTVDLGQPLLPLTDVGQFDGVRVYPLLRDNPLGYVEIDNMGCSISAAEVREALAEGLTKEILAGATGVDSTRVEATLRDRWIEQLAHPRESSPDRLDPGVRVSIVIATRDRPVELQACLTSLQEQQWIRPVEIVIVDNHPNSGLTDPILNNSPDAVRVLEPRQGLSFARNSGIRASSGELVVMIDDDVIVSANWLERLIAPFAREDVAAVTGNVLPLELEKRAQRLFEAYGGLGRGFEVKEYDREWFERSKGALPTWNLGATANAAFRAAVFNDIDIGFLHEALGAGTPAAVGEDTYLFYKILKAGYTIVYEPRAYVWHQHRRTMEGLRALLSGYTKGHVAYHLTTLIEDRDLRALRYLGARYPAKFGRRLIGALRGGSGYPPSLVMTEISGYLRGPAVFFQSRARARRLKETPRRGDGR